ncbi:MerR family transcriptional regulator [Helicobacter turcicus]|uniref:MerR family transcriptional regulator n=1 Tax=Helicobacter turcicus TaxID=2867412 RepID=A0ABS7JNV6_9HELI|nr:MerR family transcriptional regulator [Helicobacter turcicus]MBX7491099.1 MerR family transcriptional regulator [Helicobacter turcicus]MBX7545964.1 MerR family transcriptional regulator [Helicobacter turcicus]
MAYTILEVEKKTGIPSRTLRFWISKGLFPFIERDKNGIRYFAESDVRWAEWVNCLRSCNMRIKDIKRYITLAKGGIQTAKERKELLEQQFADLNEQLEILNVARKKIESKIALYNQMLETGIDFLNPNDKSYAIPTQNEKK